MLRGTQKDYGKETRGKDWFSTLMMVSYVKTLITEHGRTYEQSSDNDNEDEENNGEGEKRVLKIQR